MKDEYQGRLLETIPQNEKKIISDAIKFTKNKNPQLPEKKILEQIDTINTLSMLRTDLDTMLAAILYLSEAPDEEIKKNFGEETATIVQNKKKFFNTVEKYKDAWAVKPELKKALYFSLTKNIKLLLLTIAENYTELKKIKKMTKEEGTKTAQESQEILLPLIHRLGIKKIISNAEDIVFSYLEPEKYQDIKLKVAKKMEEYKGVSKKMRKQIIHKSKELGIPITVLYREKGIYSIHRKMQVKEKKLDDIHDLFAIRIITNSVKECYEMLGTVHSIWTPLTEEFDDYIAKPKDNNYRSLHTTIMTHDNKPIEIQIRTKEMDSEAELGIAAHWKYKGGTDQKIFDKRISWLNQFLSWQSDTKSSQREVKVSFFSNRIYVLTPKGETIELPENATVLDFAFAVHSDLGEHCVKGKINGELVGIDSSIENFDVVEIITSQKQKPKVSWLNIVKTEKAKSRIKQALQLTQVTKKEKTLDKSSDIKPTDKRIRYAKCCKPLPGDELIGYKTTKRKIMIHRKNCLELKNFSGQTPIRIDWTAKSNMQFTTELTVATHDRPGIIKELLGALEKNMQKNSKASIKQLQDSTLYCYFEINTKNKDETEALIKKLEAIQGVKKVSRS